MKKETIYDIIGIGIGPFNLGLAALANNIPGLQCKFIDQNPSFNWHPGLLLPCTRLQVPFYADLVTVADPTSRFSFLSFLKSKSRMFSFAIQENNFVTRYEYNQYCQWVAEQLTGLRFGLTCRSVYFDDETKSYAVVASGSDGASVRFHGKHIVIGIGTVPVVPDFVKEMNHPLIFHSSDYLFKKQNLLSKKNITIIGSGQSAAEIFSDLLPHLDQFDSLHWYTRAEYLYPMDNSPFAYEMSTPDYIDHFFELNNAIKRSILSGKDRLYKGINADLLRSIQNGLYLHNVMNKGDNVKVHTSCELNSITITKNDQILLGFYHTQQEQSFSHISDCAILATGYKNIVPGFLDPVKELIQWKADGFYDVKKNYSIDSGDSIFAQNADLMSHGFNSADLGLGPCRNAVILNAILGYEFFKLERNITFQNFGI